VFRKSRFITQLEVEKTKITLTHEIYNEVLSETAYQPMLISNQSIGDLKELRGAFFSIGFHELYSGPDQFYFQKICALVKKK
jgi:hypothetical protein